MIVPDPEVRKQNRRDRIRFVKKSADWVRSVPNEVWSERQSILINALLLNRANIPFTKEQYLRMIESARGIQTGEKDRQWCHPVLRWNWWIVPASEKQSMVLRIIFSTGFFLYLKI